MPDNIDPTAAIRARLARMPASARKPGTLSKWADEQNNEYWEFVGDGALSGADFVEGVIEREAQQQQQQQQEQPGDESQQQPGGENSLKQLVGNRPFAEHAAVTLLGESNPNAPIPRGQVKELSLKQLVGLMAPYMAKYAKDYTAANSVGQSSNIDDHNRTIGNVLSMGLTLPID